MHCVIIKYMDKCQLLNNCFSGWLNIEFPWLYCGDSVFQELKERRNWKQKCRREVACSCRGEHGSGATLPGQVPYSPVRTWMNHVTSMCLNILVCKIRL
jgi:hypothetical protein